MMCIVPTLLYIDLFTQVLLTLSRNNPHPVDSIG
ncbi:MAG: hypothetical protein JWP57_1702 [Spirosoma sp.]|nr:hypothetical protein [Spirosoma sp.]